MCHMGSHSVTCHLAEVTHLYAKPFKAYKMEMNTPPSSEWNTTEITVTNNKHYHIIGPIPWGHSGLLCHALSLSLASWTSMRRRCVTVPVSTPADWACGSSRGEWAQHFSNASCYYYYFFSRRENWKLSKMITTVACYTVTNVLRKAIAFHLWSAIDSRWNRNTVSLVSPVAAAMHLPSSCMSSTQSWFHAPAVSTATGKKIWVVDSALYLITLSADALLATAPASLAVWPRCNSAKVSGTVISHAMGLPCAHGIIIIGPIPWGHSGPLSRIVVVVVDIDAQAVCNATVATSGEW